jgi:iron complex outermembrane recepter protein
MKKASVIIQMMILVLMATAIQANTRPADLPPVIIDTLTRELEEVVVQAFNRQQQIIDIPGALTSVRGIVIERENAPVNILPVMQYVPGVFAQQGATNTSRVIIRGTGARVPYATGKIRGYFNNIPLTNASGVTFLEDIDPAVIESMEIIKGPAPSVYGAGLGGTVVMNARKPGGRSTGFSNAFQLGSYGLFRNVATLDAALGNVASSLVYSRTVSDGYRENNQFSRHAVTSVSQWNAGEHTNLTALIAFSDLIHHIPSSIDSTTFVSNPRAAAANWLRTQGYEDGKRLLAGLNARTAFSTRLTFDGGVFGTWHDEKEMRPFDVFYEERWSIGTRMRVIHHQLMGLPGVDLSAGGEVQVENYMYSNFQNIGGEGTRGDRLTNNREQVDTWNVFTQVDGSFGRFNLAAGVNLNYSNRAYTDRFNDGSGNLSGTYNYGLIISPRLAAGFSYRPSQAVYLSISHGFAPPSLAETLTPEGFINPEILPEKSWNLEAGIRGRVWQQRLFYDLSLYSMQVQDLLVAQRVGEDAWVGRNAGQSLHRGIESELHLMIIKPSVDRFFRELSLRSAITLNNFRFTDFTDRGNDYSGNTIPGVPDRVFAFTLYAEVIQGLYMMPSWRYAGPMQMNDANTRMADSWSVADVTLGYRRLFRMSSWDLFFRVNNVFNERYSSMILVNAPSFGSAAPRYYYPGLPTHFTVGLKMGVMSRY